jgi:glycosyltransferase involved in cell wall biosynthesis
LTHKDLRVLPLCYDGAAVRILLDYRPALVRRTGVGQYVDALARALVPLLHPGDTLTLFSSSWKDRLDPARVPGALTRDARIPVHVLNYAWHRLNWPPIEMVAGAADVVHTFHPLLMPARRAAQVVTLHDLYFLDRSDARAVEVRRDYASLASAHANRADAVIANSEYTAVQAAERLGVPPDRITVCVPGAPAWNARPAPLPGGPVLILGSDEPRKNLPGAVRAYARFARRLSQPPPLVIAGRLNDPAALRSVISECGIGDRVRPLGYVDDAAREGLYREASMLLIPSFEEGFGLPALEAMTVGVPVVAAARGALPEVVGEAGILVQPEDLDAIAVAMARVVEDTTFARDLVERGRQRARRFSWMSSAGRLLEAYRAAIARRERRR